MSESSLEALHRSYEELNAAFLRASEANLVLRERVATLERELNQADAVIERQREVVSELARGAPRRAK